MMKLTQHGVILLPVLLSLVCCGRVEAKKPKVVSPEPLTTAAPQEPKPTAVYDAFKNLTGVSTPAIQIGADWGLAVVKGLYTYEGKTPIRPAEIGFSITGVGHSRKWWAGTDKLYFLYGDKRLAIPTEYSAELGNTSIIERVLCFIPTDTFVEMALADKIALQLANTNYILQGGYLAPLTELAKSLSGAGGQAEAAGGQAEQTAKFGEFKKVYGQWLDACSPAQLRELDDLIHKRLTALNLQPAHITLTQFKQLDEGISYEDAVKILGREGAETSLYRIGNTLHTSYRWENKTPFAIVTLNFKDNRLTSRMQTNLE